MTGDDIADPRGGLKRKKNNPLRFDAY